MPEELTPVALALDPAPIPRGGGYVASNGKTSYTTTQAATAINRVNARWAAPAGGGTTTVTYAFRASGAAASPYGGFSQFNSQQIDITQQMLAGWSDVANIDFVRAGTGNSGAAAYSDSATMLLGNYVTGPSDVAGFAYYPGSTDAGSLSGDVWINSQLSYETNPTLGGYGPQTLLHEIGHALGLAHPGDYNAGNGVAITYANSANYYEDSRQYTVMSYFSESSTGANFQGNYGYSPLLDDITAIQALYGARAQRTGDTVYGFNSNTGMTTYSATSSASRLIFAAWDSGGIDTFDFSGYAQNQKIDLRAGQFSDVGGLTGNVSIYYNVTIENARGGSGSDTIIGNSADNQLYGNGGSDTIFGGAGNDAIFGGDGDDFLNGGSGANYIDGGNGTDTLLLEYDPFEYMVYGNSDGTTTVVRGTTSRDVVTSIESVRFRNSTTTFASFSAQGFDGLRYIASYGDLIGQFGANASAGLNHFNTAGRAEGRVILFNPLLYAASNADLIRAFGSDVQALETHYITSGFREGRATSTFDALSYAASNTDLLRTFSDDETGLARHYLQFGFGEGRPTASFDPYAYAIANRDLIVGVGLDSRALLLHYVQSGFTEGRAATSGFSALQYAASNPDLARAIGTNTTALELHFLRYGIAEGRSSSSFDAYSYAIVNPDLFRALGANVTALTLHYINYGIGERRSTGSTVGFDPIQYAASNVDLARAFGTNTQALLGHYITNGISEGRSINSFNAVLYLASNRDLAQAFGTNLDAGRRHYITSGLTEGRPTSGFNAVGYMLGNTAEWGRGTVQATSDYLTNRGYMLSNPFGQIGTEETGSHIVSANSSTVASFETVGDRDWYQFTLTGTQSVTVRLVGTTNASLDTYVYLHNANGTLLASNDDGGGNSSSLLTQTLGAGTYYVVAGTFSDAYSGQYRLTLSTASGNASPAADTPSPLDNDTADADVVHDLAITASSSTVFLPEALAVADAGSHATSDPFAQYAYLLGADALGGDQVSLTGQDGVLQDRASGGLVGSSGQDFTHLKSFTPSNLAA